MKIHVVTMCVVLTGFVGSTMTAEASDFLKVIKNIQVKNQGLQTPKFVPQKNGPQVLGPGPIVKLPNLNVPKPKGPGKLINVPQPKFPKPLGPGKIINVPKPNLPKPIGPGGLVNVPKPMFPPMGPGNLIPKPPVPPLPPMGPGDLAPNPPVGPVPPVPPAGEENDFGIIINLPLPHPGHGNPIQCKPPIKVCPKCGHDHCHCIPPVNMPPVKKFAMKLLNNADTKIFFSVNGLDYQMLEADGVEMVKRLSPKLHRITFHNGVEVVEFDLDPNAIYSFEWEVDQLMLYEIAS